MAADPSRRGGGPGPAATPAAPAARYPGRAALLRECIGHPAALLDRDFLQARPPLRYVTWREPMPGGQRQRVVAGTEARVLQDAQRAPPAHVFQPRLQREHLAHTQREALRDGEARLRLACCLIAGVEDGGRVMPARSEEHTSELQSPCNLVCRLLLEKKKTKRLKSYENMSIR